MKSTNINSFEKSIYWRKRDEKSTDYYISIIDFWIMLFVTGITARRSRAHTIVISLSLQGNPAATLNDFKQ